MMEDGQIELALFAAIAFIGGWFLETRLLLRWRPDWYFAVSLPLGADLVPVPRAPTGQGRTPSVLWEVAQEGRVRFWASPEERVAPSGLHGTVLVRPMVGGRYGLSVRWAPPVAPLFAALWLAFLGVARGEAGLTVPIAVVMVAGILFVYGDRMRRVAQELRFAFVEQGTSASSE